MAKALFGHVGGGDPRMAEEVRRLRLRVNELESEVTRLRASQDDLVSASIGAEIPADFREDLLALSAR